MAVAFRSPFLWEFNGHSASPIGNRVHPKSRTTKAKAGGTKAMMTWDMISKTMPGPAFKAVRTPINSYPNNHNLRCLDLDARHRRMYNGGYAIKGMERSFEFGSSGRSHGTGGMWAS